MRCSAFQPNSSCFSGDSIETARNDCSSLCATTGSVHSPRRLKTCSIARRLGVVRLHLESAQAYPPKLIPEVRSMARTRSSVVLTTLGSVTVVALGIRCAPHGGASPGTGPPAASTEATASPSAVAIKPAPLTESFPTNPWNQQRFERFRRLEKVDADWAAPAEEGLRAALLNYDSTDRRVMRVECRQETCVIGFVAWLSGKADQTVPWPDVQWAGSAGGRAEPRDDGWKEAVYVLKRHVRDYPDSVPRVPSLAKPASDPACTGVRENVGRLDQECRSWIGFASTTACFDDSHKACECACSKIGVEPAGCLIAARGRQVRCSLKGTKLNSIFFDD